MREMVPLEEAQSLLIGLVEKAGIELIPLHTCWGRVLAETIIAGHDLPPFDCSLLDGYAVRASDTSGAEKENPASLKVAFELPAGVRAEQFLQSGQAARIMTGAPIPQGANAVIKQEETMRDFDQVLIFNPVKAGTNVIRAGVDVRKGERVLEPGISINAGAVGMLAALGYEKVKVYRRPRVAVFSTGGELMDVPEQLLPGKIYNSSLYTLSVLIRQAGAEPLFLPIVPDHTEIILAQIEEAIEKSDIVITTGGASVGDYDLMRQVFSRTGAEMLFWKVDMRPGTPVVAARLRNKLLIGLSGNPSAALIAFEHLVRPSLLVKGGRNKWERTKVKAILEDDFQKETKRRRFLRAKVYPKNNGFRVKLDGKQAGVLKSILWCNALIDIPANSAPLRKGEEVEIILLEESGVY